MDWSIRRLDPVVDEALFHLAFGWLEDSPRWRRETEVVFGTLDRGQYLVNAHDNHRIDIGVFDGPEFIADVILTLRAKDVYEVHFEAAAHANSAMIVEAAGAIRDQMFTEYGAQSFYTWTPKWNRGVLRINKALGLQPTGVKMLKGTVRGRLIDWLQCTLSTN